MPRVSAKRQITLPLEQCRVANINPGDEYASFVDGQGNITILKKEPGIARGALSHLDVDDQLTDEDSLLDGLHDRH